MEKMNIVLAPIALTEEQFKKLSLIAERLHSTESYTLGFLIPAKVIDNKLEQYSSLFEEAS